MPKDIVECYVYILESEKDKKYIMEYQKKEMDDLEGKHIISPSSSRNW